MKKYIGHSLTKKQIRVNHKKSKIRARIEHIIGFMESSMHEMYIHSRMMVRVTAQ